jgi:hypothetical protein
MITVPLTPAQYTAKSAELLAKEDIEISGTAGVASRSGVSLHYSYDGATLSVTVDHAPPFLKGHIENEIRAWLTA